MNRSKKYTLGIFSELDQSEKVSFTSFEERDSSDIWSFDRRKEDPTEFGQRIARESVDKHWPMLKAALEKLSTKSRK